MKYSELIPTGLPFNSCTGCREYKGIVACTNEECGVEFCIFCESDCPTCGEGIDFSQ